MGASAHLNRLRNSVEGPLTLGELAARLGREGIGLLVLLVSIPFLHPLPMAGLTIPVGLILTAAGIQLALEHQTPYLPRFVSERELDAAMVKKILGAAEKLLLFLERFAHPRWRALARAQRLIGTAIAIAGAVFTLPLYFPFGNLFSAAGLVLLGLALLEEDGLLAFLGLGVTSASMLYHVAIARLAWEATRSLLGRLG